MEKITLKAASRDVVGKKVKMLRAGGMIPANLYGKGVASVSLELPLKDFQAVYHKAGETGLVELAVDSKTYHTLISKVQINPVSREIIHAEFHAVSLTEKIKANVPVVLEGESPAVANGVGILLQTLNEIEVEALPMNLPEKVTVEVSNLAEVDQQVTVSQLKIDDSVTVLTSNDEVIVRVAPAVSEEAVKEAEVEAAKAAAEAATVEGQPATDTGAPATEETKTSEGKEE